MSIHKTAAGKFQVRWREAGRNRAKNFTSESVAKKFDLEVQSRLQTRGMTFLDAGKVTLGEFITETYWPYKSRKISDTTKKQYRSLYERHVYGTISTVPLRELSTRTLLEWQTDVEEELPAPSLIKLMTFLQGALSHAVKCDELQANPMRELDKPKQVQKLAPTPLSPVEIETIRSQMNERDATITSVLGYAGLRPGELNRLTWEDIGDKQIRVASGKTGRERFAILLLPVKADLDQWKMQSGVRSGLVFSGFDLRNWRKRIWKPAFHDANILGKDVPYRLRSSCVSLLLSDNTFTLGAIALSMGHSLDVMSSYYYGIINEFQGKGVDASNEILKARQKWAA